MDGYVVVVGAANIDIGGTPYKTLIPADSNPGDISINYGGVGRNIAHNLCKLGIPVVLLSAIGGDVLGADMLKYCEDVGMDTSKVLKLPNETSSMYLYVNNDSGDMELAIDHMDICKEITAEYFDDQKDVINGAKALVVDANISADAFRHLKEICEVPLYVDPVSTVLAERFKPYLDGVEMIKPNRLEAEYLTDMTIQTEADYKAAVNAMLGMGVKRVFMSMGSEGMLAADKDNMFVVGECPADVICTTGAGDAATAAIVWSSLVLSDPSNEEFNIYKNENPLVTASKAANAVAAMTVSVKETNNPNLSHDTALNQLNTSTMGVREI